jgi:hypothetical protein
MKGRNTESDGERKKERMNKETDRMKNNKNRKKIIILQNLYF